MTRRRQRIDRELLILLAIFIALALAAQATRHDAGFVVVTETLPAIVETAPTIHLYDAAANPYWAPAHAFTRRPTPLDDRGALPAPPANAP
jgi:hypothetical protein